MLGIRVQKQLVRIKAKAICRIIWTINSVTIQQSRASLWKVAMPNLIILPTYSDSFDLAPSFRIKQAKLDSLGMFGEKRKVNALTIPGRAQRMCLSGPHRSVGELWHI